MVLQAQVVERNVKREVGAGAQDPARPSLLRRRNIGGHPAAGFPVAQLRSEKVGENSSAGGDKREEKTFSNISNAIDSASFRTEAAKLEWTRELDSSFGGNAADRAYARDPYGSLSCARDLSASVAAMRFDLSGTLLRADDATMNTDQTLLRGLHHHGDEMGKPGYTISELLHLARSRAPQQRVLALRAVAGIYRSSAALSAADRERVAEASNHLMALIALRMAADDGNIHVVAAAFEALCAALATRPESRGRRRFAPTVTHTITAPPSLGFSDFAGDSVAQATIRDHASLMRVDAAAGLAATNFGERVAYVISTVASTVDVDIRRQLVAAAMNAALQIALVSFDFAGTLSRRLRGRSAANRYEIDDDEEHEVEAGNEEDGLCGEDHYDSLLRLACDNVDALQLLLVLVQADSHAARDKADAIAVAVTRVLVVHSDADGDCDAALVALRILSVLLSYGVSLSYDIWASVAELLLKILTTRHDTHWLAAAIYQVAHAAMTHYPVQLNAHATASDKDDDGGDFRNVVMPISNAAYIWLSRDPRELSDDMLASVVEDGYLFRITCCVRLLAGAQNRPQQSIVCVAEPMRRLTQFVCANLTTRMKNAKTSREQSHAETQIVNTARILWGSKSRDVGAEFEYGIDCLAALYTVYASDDETWHAPIRELLRVAASKGAACACAGDILASLGVIYLHAEPTVSDMQLSRVIAYHSVTRMQDQLLALRVSALDRMAALDAECSSEWERAASDLVAEERASAGISDKKNPCVYYYCDRNMWGSGMWVLGYPLMTLFLIQAGVGFSDTNVISMFRKRLARTETGAGPRSAEANEREERTLLRGMRTLASGVTTAGAGMCAFESLLSEYLASSFHDRATQAYLLLMAFHERSPLSCRRILLQHVPPRQMVQRFGAVRANEIEVAVVEREREGECKGDEELEFALAYEQIKAACVNDRGALLWEVVVGVGREH